MEAFRGQGNRHIPSAVRHSPVGMESMMTVIATFLSSSLPIVGLSVLMGCAALNAWRATPAPRLVPVRVRTRR
jgi:hypothetical protein